MVCRRLLVGDRQDPIEILGRWSMLHSEHACLTRFVPERASTTGVVAYKVEDIQFVIEWPCWIQDANLGRNVSVKPS